MVLDFFDEEGAIEHKAIAREVMGFKFDGFFEVGLVIGGFLVRQSDDEVEVDVLELIFLNERVGV